MMPALSWKAACVALVMALSFALPALAENIIVNGAQRSYLLDGLGDRPKPLLIALHGAGGSAKGFRKRSGLKEKATAAGFVIAFPNSNDGHWNDGRVNPSGQLVSDSEDEAFILALVKELVSKGIADETQVFITGHSNGGMMSFAMGCKHSKIFKAIAPVSANIPRPMDCKGQGPVAVLNIVGVKDRVVPFDGVGIFGRKRRGELLSVMDGLAVMKKRNDCRGDKVSDSREARIDNGTDCKARTLLWQIKKQGHAWPDEAPAAIVGFFRNQ